MSTSACISILDHSTRTLTSIDLSCDGYYSHAGNILLDHYANTKRVNDLMKLGYLFALNPFIPRHLPSLKVYWARRDSDRFHKLFGARLNKTCIPLSYTYNSGPINIEAEVRNFPINWTNDDGIELRDIKPHGRFHYIWEYRQWYFPFYNKNNVFIEWRILTKNMCKPIVTNDCIRNKPTV